MKIYGKNHIKYIIKMFFHVFMIIENIMITM